MTRRTRGREIALQVLYLLEQNPGADPAEVERFIERRLPEPRRQPGGPARDEAEFQRQAKRIHALRAFARALVEGVRRHQPEIDALISEVAENWRLDRMAAIDRNILRLGAFEMLHCPDLPPKVAINEALELAKRYSTAQSSRFVNGILDRLQATERPAGDPVEAPPLPDPDAPAPPGS
jgi:N utilization substance protein B